jgi:hypothetical protein
VELGEQAPAPSHVAAVETIPFAQVAVRHWTVEPGKPLHVFCTKPSHCVMPQGLVPPPTHAGLVPCGAPITAVHVPTELVTSHAAHCPVQDVSQQWLSTQKPLEHCVAVAQPEPSGKPPPASSGAISMSAARAVVVLARAAAAHIAPNQMAIRM